MAICRKNPELFFLEEQEADFPMKMNLERVNWAVRTGWL